MTARRWLVRVAAIASITFPFLLVVEATIGWTVDPATAIYAICERFRKAGVSKVRTLLSRDNTLILSFFRSQGMMIGPFIPHEMDLEP